MRLAPPPSFDPTQTTPRQLHPSTCFASRRLRSPFCCARFANISTPRELPCQRRSLKLTSSLYKLAQTQRSVANPLSHEVRKRSVATPLPRTKQEKGRSRTPFCDTKQEKGRSRTPFRLLRYEARKRSVANLFRVGKDGKWQNGWLESQNLVRRCGIKEAKP